MTHLYEGFEAALQRIQGHGWVRGVPSTQDGRVCVGQSLILAFQAKGAIPGHVAAAVDEELRRRSPYYRLYRWRNGGCTQNAIIHWNDIWWRRKKAVVSLLEALTHDHEVAYLRWRVTILEGQVASLRQEIDLYVHDALEETDRAQLAELEEELAWSWERLSCLTH